MVVTVRNGRKRTASRATIDSPYGRQSGKIVGQRNFDIQRGRAAVGSIGLGEFIGVGATGS